MSTSSSHFGFIKTYLSPHISLAIFATFLSLLLGFVVAPFANLVGPALLVLNNDYNTTYHLEELFGEKIAQIIGLFLDANSFQGHQLLAALPLSIFTFGLLRTSLSASIFYSWERIGEFVSVKIRDDLIKAFLFINPENRQEIEKQEENLASSMATDVKMTREYIARFYGGLPRELIQVLVLSLNLWLISADLFYLFMIGIIPSGVILSRVGKKIRRRSKNALDQFSRLTEWLQQRLLGVETIKHYQTEAIETNKMQAIVEDLEKQVIRTIRVKARTSPIIETVAIFALIIVFFFAFRQIENGQLSGNLLLNFFATIGLLSQSAGKLGKHFNSNREASAAISRITEQISAYNKFHTQKIAHNYLASSSPKITCKNLTFRYDQASANALDEFDFEFTSGNFYAILGHSGSGKSTLSKILMAEVQPTSGTIQFHCHSASPILFVPQKVRLLKSHLAANIAYPNSEINRDLVEDVLRKMDLGDYTTRAFEPDVIGELSGGQSQRVLLARVFYHDKEVLIIDEGTSALDPRLEKQFYDDLAQLNKANKIIIAIAHRPAILDYADEVVILEKGKKTASGKVDAIKQHPIFKKFWENIHT